MYKWMADEVKMYSGPPSAFQSSLGAAFWEPHLQDEELMSSEKNEKEEKKDKNQLAFPGGLRA